MQTTFTHEFMKENCGCYSESQLLACSFMANQSVTLESILDSKISLKDKYWFVCKKLATKEQNQQIAIGVASIVLEIYEKKYPDDQRPRKAIQAAKDYLAGTISRDDLLTARRAAAYAAAAAAADAYADADAYAAAYAAAAAAADAYADADADADAYAAAYAAAAAAAAAAADAYADAYKTALLNFLKDFVKNN